MPCESRKRTFWLTGLVALWLTIGVPSWGVSQTALPTLDPPAPSPNTVEAPTVPVPPGSVTIEQLAERLQAMEAMNRRLADELQQTRVEHQQQMQLLLERLNAAAPDPATPLADPAPPIDLGADPPLPGLAPSGDPFVSPVPDYTEGQLPPLTPAPGFPLSERSRPLDAPLSGRFRRGFQFESPDQEYTLRINYESQIEGRV